MHEIRTAVEPPEFILQWIAQLLDPKFVEMMRHIPYDRVDVQLATSRGKVSRDPVVVVNGGQAQFSQK